MKFALVETNRSAPAAVEVMLTSGERLRIAPGIDWQRRRAICGAASMGCMRW
jgi:hypothetical protein